MQNGGGTMTLQLDRRDLNFDILLIHLPSGVREWMDGWMKISVDLLTNQLP